MAKKKPKEPVMGTSLGDLLFQKNVKCGDAAGQDNRIAELEQEKSRLEERSRLMEEQCGTFRLSNKTLSGEVARLDARVRELEGERKALASALLDRAIQELKSGRYLSVPGLLEAVLVHEPENLKAKINLAVVHAELGFRELAVETLREVLAKDPQNKLASRNLNILTGESVNG